MCPRCWCCRTRSRTPAATAGRTAVSSAPGSALAAPVDTAGATMATKACRTPLHAPPSTAHASPVISPRSLMSPLASRYSGEFGCSRVLRSYVLPSCRPAVLPQEHARIEARVEGSADDLAEVIDARGLADHVARQRVQVLDAVAPRPEERLEIEGQHPAAHIAREIGEPDHRARVVDRHRRVPALATQCRQLHGAALLPQQCVPGAEGTDRISAVPGDTDDLTGIVDGRGGRSRVTGKGGQDALLVSPRTPQNRLKLQHLRQHAARIVERRFRPADRLPGVVDAGREAVIAAEQRQLSDRA